jgi:endoglucanase
MGHIGDAPDHHISEARLVRVAEIVGMAHNAGLKVIINLHHDGTTSSTTEENGWLSISKACQSDDEYKKITHKFVRVWKQIAVYFKNYGDWLMFEAFNELHDGGWFWASRNVPIEQYTLINEWNQLFTDIVRSTAANNASRYLVIPSYCTGPEALRSPNFRLPNDSASGRQVVSFHYYRPDAVGLNGTKSDWGTNADKNVVDNDFRPFKAAFIDKGIPVTIGEVGAVRQLYPSDPAKEAQARESRKNYLAHIYGTAKKYGLVPIYWDNGVFTGNGEKFGLFNRTTGQPQSAEFQECVDAMIDAVK